jgi:uncharacterized SAM-binding protein YcdF (DUF218 family)
MLMLLALGLAGTYLFRNIAVFLTVNEPVDADYLVIEGWMDKEELEQALDYFDTHEYSKAIIVGGPISDDFHGIDTNAAERAAGYLWQKGLSEDRTAVVTSPYSAQDRTFLNAVMVREWFRRQGIEPSRLDVFSSHVHTRRSRDLYRHAFGENVAIGIIASRPRDFEPTRWWYTSGSGKYVAVEFAGWLMVKCCFTSGEPGSHFEKWGIEKTGKAGNYFYIRDQFDSVNSPNCCAQT